MNAVGLIFADNYEVEINELTETRTMAALPFGARYRVVDYLLSNITNAGIHDVGIITNSRYESLMDHVSSGIEWDLERKNGGLHFLPPFSYHGRGDRYEHILEAMQANVSFLRNCDEEYVIACSSTCVGNIDLAAMMDYHIKTDAYITVLCTRNPRNKQVGIPTTEYLMDPTGRIQNIEINRKPILQGAVVGANIYIVRRADLLDLLENSEREMTSWRRDVLIPHLKDRKIMGYVTGETLLYLDNVVAYLQSSLDLLDPNLRDELFHQENRPIITRVGDSAPAWYGPRSSVRNSLIAAGTIIEGEVRNSVIFRGVHIKKGSVIENSVVMRNATIGEHVHLNYAILDKNVIINDKRMLSGYITHPFVVKYGAVI
ncbi:glucose-1-phosphate adenylyltransferase subunit GlgD [Hornefia butyriciproducens]|uniref:glucose-1-phosphate adenylyltransferase subunit GlgD n=1 Tax=Hornefia butyriciproducens TaxID=2652293 RepID=UPI0023F220AA|nr:glucose-1-phosphate adenylyltransferase subunit GlgD [Hornefia butyriciproducens]MDD6298850.1 glucose-1-phosphate adenylyltransferase subunit GlgD [Hornefia butyriciproducens]